MHGARGLEFLLLIECGQLKAPQFSEMQLVCLKNRAGLEQDKAQGLWAWELEAAGPASILL